MVLTRRSARRRTLFEGQEEPRPSVHKKKTPIESSSGVDKDLELLTEKVFDRLKNPAVQKKSDDSPPDVLQLASTSDCPYKLASTLQPKLEQTPYFSQESVRVTSEKEGHTKDSLCQNEADALLKKTVITPDFETKDSLPPIHGPSRQAREKARQAARGTSTGKGWFDMPAPQITPELKNDLRLLRMRNVLDPSHHYKANDSKKLPRYFQVGRVVGGAGEFYSSRIPRKQQKRTLVEELLSNEEARSYQKKKYLELQDKFSSGSRRLKRIQHKRRFKTDH